jgi:hypothetical protein
MIRLSVVVPAALAACLVLPGSVAGQTSAPAPTDLAHAVTPDQRVTVRLRDGTRLNGRVTVAAPDHLVLRTGSRVQDIPAREVAEVRKQGDRLWNGALIGAGAGAASGAVIGASRPGCSGSDASFCGGIGALAGVGIGALLGVTVDALFPHTDLLYAARQAPERATGRLVVLPVLTAHRRALTVAYMF